MQSANALQQKESFETIGLACIISLFTTMTMRISHSTYERSAKHIYFSLEQSNCIFTLNIHPI